MWRVAQEVDEHDHEVVEEQSFSFYLQERSERKQELAERDQELAIKAQELASRTLRFLRIDSLKAENDENRLEQMKTFLVDYAHLITQLKPDEKVLIADKTNQMYQYPAFYGVENIKRNRLSAEITMKDAQAYQQGEISREEALARISVNKNDQPKKVYKDLELYSSIMDRLYDADLSETFYTQGRISYEHITNLGAIFYMNTVSSIRAKNDLWNVPTQDKKSLPQSERDALVKSMYPKFEQQLKENMVEYGRTISSLKPTEQLIFNVKITKCEDCDIPKNLALSIKAADLTAYGKGDLSREETIKRITVSKEQMQ